jgi:hypothetical protein
MTTDQTFAEAAPLEARSGDADRKYYAFGCGALRRVEMPLSAVSRRAELVEGGA